MSGIAHIFLSSGHNVSGSDKTPSPITAKLRALGADIYDGHDSSNIKNPDLVVYTSAVDRDNPELKAARDKGIKTMDRATVLGLIMKNYKYNVAVAGAHGKTTATSMISLIVENAGLDPTLLIGGELDSIGGNVKVGKGPYLITEACEYRDNFLKFFPYIAVILNIDQDHPDFFRDFNHIKSTFERFAGLVPDHGWVVACHDDKALMEIVPRLSCNVITYGLTKDARINADNIAYDNRGCASFDLYFDGDFVDNINLSVPGEHNVLNGLSAIAVSHIFGIDIEVIKATLQSFSGTHRRFELKGYLKGCAVVDDYAHHPAEIRATLTAAQNFPHRRIRCVFQPHTYTRTKFLLKDFAKSFSGADEVIITDIYAAREKDTGDIHSTDLTEAIKCYNQRTVYMPDFVSIAEYLYGSLQSGDLLLTMGAGDVYKVAEMLLKDKGA